MHRRLGFGGLDFLAVDLDSAYSLFFLWEEECWECS